MITDSYDDKSPAKINVKKNDDAVAVDAVIFTFSQEIEKYVIAHYDCKKVGEYLIACGPTSVYLLKYHGKKFGFYLAFRCQRINGIIRFCMANQQDTQIGTHPSGKIDIVIVSAPSDNFKRAARIKNLYNTMLH